ncbi:MAG: hypothetical protein B6D45_09055 [Ignavibacteriales bacterium UTCHB3]|nr:MAG: hypothetical protein B6D45_09055 [Ignavibacteriales bacterium UTCHB3]
MKSTTPVKTGDVIEYRAMVYYHYDEIKKKQFYVLTITTVKEFVFLNYLISVDVRKIKNVIDISLLGLNTQQSYYVQPGPARVDLYFEDLYGEHTFNVIKQDGSINSFTVDFNIYKKDIAVVGETIPEKKNNRHFCTFRLAPELNTFEEV